MQGQLKVVQVWLGQPPETVSISVPPTALQQIEDVTQIAVPFDSVPAVLALDGSVWDILLVTGERIGSATIKINPQTPHIAQWIIQPPILRDRLIDEQAFKLVRRLI